MQQRVVRLLLRLNIDLLRCAEDGAEIVAEARGAAVCSHGVVPGLEKRQVFVRGEIDATVQQDVGAQSVLFGDRLDRAQGGRGGQFAGGHEVIDRVFTRFFAQGGIGVALGL